jgi:hypothetical protein
MEESRSRRTFARRLQVMKFASKGPYDGPRDKQSSPVDEAPGWNGWKSRSAEEIPGPLSEMRITTEESSE